jgi:hypothetical protein
MANTYTGSDSGKEGLRVRESDGSPNVAGVSDIVLTAADFSITDDGNGTITLSTGAGGGNTLDQAYDEGGAGSGRTIDADSGAVAITVSDTDNNGVLEVTQNDTSNNPATLTITNTGTGDTITTSNAVGEVFTISSSEVVINEIQGAMDFRVEGDGQTNLLICDASSDRVGVGIAAPASLLEVSGASKLREGFSVADPGAITLTAASHAGAYLIESANVTITLPATSTVGEQYVFIATHSSGLTIGRNGNDINGASSNVTVAQYKAKTAIAIGSNDWVVIG